MPPTVRIQPPVELVLVPAGAALVEAAVVSAAVVGGAVGATVVSAGDCFVATEVVDGGICTAGRVEGRPPSATPASAPTTITPTTNGHVLRFMMRPV
jgi:hypothetical protein